MRPINIHEAPFTLAGGEPPGFQTGEALDLRAAGGSALAVRLYEAPPGQSLCPYHYEYEEEWLLVIAGSPTLRTPAGEQPLRAGDLLCFPTGPEGAHQVINRSADSARVLMWSSTREPSVAVYPDSDKIGVWPGNSADDVLLHRRDGAVDYWEGETPPD